MTATFIGNVCGYPTSCHVIYIFSQVLAPRSKYTSLLCLLLLWVMMLSCHAGSIFPMMRKWWLHQFCIGCSNPKNSSCPFLTKIRNVYKFWMTAKTLQTSPYSWKMWRGPTVGSTCANSPSPQRTMEVVGRMEVNLYWLFMVNTSFGISFGVSNILL